MELSLEIRLLLFAVLAAAVVIVLYFELRVLSKKRDARMEARMAREELYNLVVTTEAIADSLRNRGLEVGEADILSKRAKAAYDARDSVKARSLCMQARKLMSDAKLPRSEDDGEAPFGITDTPPQQTEPEQRVLPDDGSLQSGFIISCVRSHLDSVPEADRDRAVQILEDAEREQEAGNYDRALALANSAKRLLEGTFCEEPPSAPVCPKCSHGMNPGDVFCSRCGERVG